MIEILDYGPLWLLGFFIFLYFICRKAAKYEGSILDDHPDERN